MFTGRIRTGTFIFVMLAYGCTAGDDPAVDPAGRWHLALDIRIDTVAQHEAVTIPPEVIHPRYKPLLNEHDELVVSGRSVEELLEMIGEPMSMIRQGQRGSGWHKEVWILPIYREDSTGLYLYIQNGQVVDWRLDTFVGIGNHPNLLEWF